MCKEFQWAKIIGDDFKAEVVGETMKLMFEELGYSVYNYTRWDERLAPRDWDSNKSGMPNTYYMTPQIDYMKEYKKYE